MVGRGVKDRRPRGKWLLGRGIGNKGGLREGILDLLKLKQSRQI